MSDEHANLFINCTTALPSDGDDGERKSDITFAAKDCFMYVNAADWQEMIAAVRDLTKGASYEQDYSPSGERGFFTREVCFYCQEAISACAPGCVRACAEALLSRLEAT